MNHAVTPYRLKLAAVAALAVIASASALACGGPAQPAPSPTPGLGEEAVRPTAQATPLPSPAAEVDDYNPSATMYRLHPGRSLIPALTRTALRDVRERGDKSQVPVIIEMVRFLPTVELWEEAVLTLRELTGQNFAVDQMNQWAEWLGRNLDDYPPPERYLNWKINLLALISPRYGPFLISADETSRINLVEVTWGGVRPDGIPDLNNPPVVDAAAADYLNPDDRVFGVSINGEHRAYPLRIANAHEMVNDWLGGEPISLAY